jgi:hypothetical protein
MANVAYPSEHFIKQGPIEARFDVLGGHQRGAGAASELEAPFHEQSLDQLPGIEGEVVGAPIQPHRGGGIGRHRSSSLKQIRPEFATRRAL